MEGRCAGEAIVDEDGTESSLPSAKYRAKEIYELMDIDMDGAITLDEFITVGKFIFNNVDEEEDEGQDVG